MTEAMVLVIYPSYEANTKTLKAKEFDWAIESEGVWYWLKSGRVRHLFPWHQISSIEIQNVMEGSSLDSIKRTPSSGWFPA